MGNERVALDRTLPRRRQKGGCVAVVLIVLIGYLLAAFTLPLPTVRPQVITLTSLTASSSPLSWPAFGAAAIGAQGYGVLDSHGDNHPLPTASIAKVLTALAVLKQYPLLKDQQGPSIAVTAADLNTYQKYVANSGSVVQVQAGEQLTEYQALQAMLLPSANNIADMLATWAFGSTDNYVHFANSFAKSLGLNQTTVADASGFAPQTMSTAHDLVLLGENVMDNPVLADIVGQTQADIPVAGTIYNVNLLVGHQEVVGIKTGNTDEAGGCFLVAARHNVAPNHTVIVIAAVMGAPDLSTAVSSTLPLLQSTYKNFTVATVLRQGSVVGTYHLPWGQTEKVTASQDVSGVVWAPSPPVAQVTLPPFGFSSKSATTPIPAGAVTASFGRQVVSVPTANPAPPVIPLGWRLTHPFRGL